MKTRNFLIPLLVVIGLVSCKNDNNTGGENEPTYLTVEVKLPSKLSVRTGDDNFTGNQDGTYAGDDLIKTLDIYLQDANGDITSERFEGTDIAVSSSGSGAAIVSPSAPFLTTPGQKTLYVVLNDTQQLGDNFGPGSEENLIDTDGLAAIENGKDVILMSGKGSIFVEPSVSMQQAAAGANKQTVNVSRVASRVIVTHTITDFSFDDGTGNTGTISNLEYCVAQGTNMVYWLAPSGTTIYETYGYDYVPKINVSGNVPYPGAENAMKYYDYSDLSTPSAIPSRPAGANGYKELKGKFLFENTHKFGAARDNTDYRKGNTAYVMVKVRFTPDQASIVDGGALTGGTFYVGASDGKIYSSKAAADEGVQNQKVKTYLNGKMLYFAWLNPDDVDAPLNSPVIRNNIYHINVRSFNSLGQNWNPLYPEDPDTALPQNPDSKPDPDEPKSPVDPYDPLSVDETYMTIEATVLDWVVNSYNIDF